LVQVTLISLIIIILVGLVLSYTRAAWLSVLGSMGIAVVLYYKVSWKPIAVLASVAILAILLRWDQIQM